MMNELPDVEDLLLEQRLISEEERAVIFREIDDEFRSFLHHEELETENSARSRGIVVPLIIGIAVLLSALGVIGIFQTTFYRQSPANSPAVVDTGYSSQWQILNLYLEESEKVLQEKDAEIEYYRKEIRAYDRRIDSLRELIKLKDEIQNRMLDERRSLLDQGFDEQQINERLSTMEREVIAGLSPEVVKFYDLSIEEINAQIDRLLNQRESNELKLRTSLEERTLLADETSAIEEDIRTRQSETYVSDELRRTIDKLNTTISDYEQLEDSRSVFEAEYSEILSLIGNDEFESAMVEADNLEQLIRDQSENQNPELKYNLNMENQVVRLIRDYLEIRMATEASRIPVEPAGIPETAASDDPEQVLIGRITTVEFNQIIFRPTGSVSVETGDVFIIYRNEDAGGRVKIGSGVISTVSDDEISGRLQSLVTLSNKPESGDDIMVPVR